MLLLENGNYFKNHEDIPHFKTKVEDRTVSLKKSLSLIKYQATHDSLTGLGNRIELLENLQTAIKFSEAEHKKFAVFFLDLDRFKLVNDSLSHETGDQILQETSNRLKKLGNDKDTIARLGGDEFIILFTDIDEETLVNSRIIPLLNVFQRPSAAYSHC